LRAFTDPAEDVSTSKSKQADPIPVAIDFERSLAELEAIVDKLEHGELSLDESLKQFERGVQLTRACQSALKEAEQKVEILMRKNGEPESFDPTPLDAGESDED
jgi:exodeoxyribonuclease VII small subunit